MAATTARMDEKKWHEIKLALINGNWLTREDGEDVAAEIERGWIALAEQAAQIDALTSARDSLMDTVDRAPVTALERDMAEQIKAATANIKIVLDSAARRDARLQHAHDAAGALYKAASAVAALTWPGEETEAYQGARAMNALRAALDPEQQAAALREVQRRDGLDGQIAALRAEVAGLRQARPVLTANEALQWAYGLANHCNNEPRHISAALSRAWEHDKPGSLEMHRLPRNRPVLTEEAARAMAEQAMMSPCSGDWVDQIAAMLMAVARGEWATPAPAPEAATPSGLMLNLEPAPTPAQSTREIHEQLIRGWEAAARRDGVPLPAEKGDGSYLARAMIEAGAGTRGSHEADCGCCACLAPLINAHDTAEMAVTTGEAAPAPAQMDAPDGPICGCGMPSAYESGLCSTCATPIEIDNGTPSDEEVAAKIPDFLKSEAGRRAFNAYPSPEPFDPQAFIAAQKAHNAAKKEAP